MLGWWANNFYSGARSTRPEVGGGNVKSHLTNNIVRLKRARAVESTGHTTMEEMGKAHKIHDHSK
jgi:hypothetical protein